LKIFEYVKKVEFAEADMGGLLYHPNYIVYFDHARNAAFEEMGYSLARMFQDAVAPLIARVHSRFVQPAHFSETLYIYSGVKKVGNTSMVMAHSMFNRKQELDSSLLLQSLSDMETSHQDLVHAAEISLVWFSFQSKKPVSPKEEVRLALTRS
jgi:acyl-CoA thioester hydrolase